MTDTITVYTVFAHTLYASPKFHALSKDDLYKKLAPTCRQDWEANRWPGRDESPEAEIPPIPETDKEVVDTYFWGDPDEDDNGPYLEFHEYDVSLTIQNGRVYFWTEDDPQPPPRTTVEPDYVPIDKVLGLLSELDCRFGHGVEPDAHLLYARNELAKMAGRQPI